jgi:serine protease Do
MIPAPATPPSNGFADVAKAVTPVVANITTVMVEKLSDGCSMLDELRERIEEFFDGPFSPRGFRGSQWLGDPRGHRGGGQGPGVIVSSDGTVLTNNHVIDNAREVTVTLTDKREIKGKIVGADPKADLVVVKIDGSNLPTVMYGGSVVVDSIKCSRERQACNDCGIM